MEKIKLYNTLTRGKEEFQPIKNDGVLMYHCGPTVYWTQHIGNMRGMTAADLVVRSLEFLGYKVKLARNYTDVGHLTSDSDEGEDKMEKGAKRENKSPREIADKYIKIFERDAAKLNLREANCKPRATECVPDMIKFVQVLLDKNFAYATDLAIYFEVSKVKNYTKLSGQNLEENLKGAGKAEVEDKNKKHPADFALWFFRAGKHGNALQYWPSPFQSNLVENGEGFPGWHLECSVMAKKFLGDTIDIHMGGIEHIPVHHTNEIAQSEAANGVDFAHYWLHNEHLILKEGKMSKSAGTAYSVSEIEEKGYNPLSLRYLFLQAHYRSKINFDWDALDAAERGLKNFYSGFLALGEGCGKVNKKFIAEFTAKISDDFNIPQALAVAQSVLKSDLKNEDKKATLLEFDKVLGLGLNTLKTEKIKIPEEIIKLAEKRQAARANQDWPMADEIRKKIKQKGFEIEDQGDEYEIKAI